MPQPLNAAHPLRSFMLASCLLLLLQGCHLINTGSGLTATEINELMDKGDAALAQNKLTSPADDNAMLYYQQVLDAEPDNTAAKAGTQKVAGRYLVLAERDYKSGRSQQAIAYLEHAEEIGGVNTNTRALRQKLLPNSAAAKKGKSAQKTDVNAQSTQGENTNEQATETFTVTPNAKTEQSSAAIKPRQTNSYPLSISALNERSDALKKQLADIARSAKQQRYMALITARSYLEGRWIVNTMRDAVPDYTLDTDVVTGPQPIIVLQPPQ